MHPQKSRDLIIIQDSLGHLVRNPQKRTFSLGPDEIKVLENCDGHHGVMALSVLSGGKFTCYEIATLLLLFDSLGFLTTSAETKRKSSWWQKITKIPICHFPTYSLSKYKKQFALYARLLFAAIVLSGVFLLITLVVKGRNIPLVFGRINYLQWDTIPFYIISVFMITLLHEFSHAATLIAFGGTSFEMGIQIYYFIFCCYVDVTGIQRLKEKWKRLVVWSAGVLSQLILLAVSGGVLLYFSSSLNQQLARFLGVACIVNACLFFFNLTFMLKLDGYYILSEWLDIDNLRERSQAHVLHLLRDQNQDRETMLEKIYSIVGIVTILYIPVFVLGVFSYFLHPLNLF